MKDMRPVILVFVAHYLPGSKSGGPVRSVSNLVERLGEEFSFRIVTSDRDWKDTHPYSGITADSWNKVGKAQVFYLSPGNRSLSAIAKILANTHYDALYLNSFFDPVFTQKPLWARKLGLAPQKPLVIAPRGEFSPGAFSIKFWKKAPYTWIISKIGLLDRVIWQATTEHEVADIQGRLTLGRSQKIMTAAVIASDVAPVPDVVEAAPERPLQIVFLSRITPKKNLDFALKVLAKVQVPVQFDIYGPIGETEYWDYCNSLIEKLPANIAVNYGGALEHSEVADVFRQHDLFFFPTHGENYGHVIMESLLAGTPLLIANTTPWRNLEQAGVGWDIPLSNEQEYVNKIHAMAQYPSEKLREWRKQVRAYASAYSGNPEIIEANRSLFLRALM